METKNTGLTIMKDRSTIRKKRKETKEIRRAEGCSRKNGKGKDEKR